mmetsp:Transcript_10956/g.16708  ORF Transcript_10956/g.16708 Transcript_10956/m.16708 type:complete len:213 (+) Transcript_10956:821-1459(+)
MAGQGLQDSGQHSKSRMQRTSYTLRHVPLLLRRKIPYTVIFHRAFMRQQLRLRRRNSLPAHQFPPTRLLLPLIFPNTILMSAVGLSSTATYHLPRSLRNTTTNIKTLDQGYIHPQHRTSNLHGRKKNPLFQVRSLMSRYALRFLRNGGYVMTHVCVVQQSPLRITCGPVRPMLLPLPYRIRASRRLSDLRFTAILRAGCSILPLHMWRRLLW